MVIEAQVETADVWRWLDAVPDPEIPAISVVDLGIVRDVQWEGAELVVTITPTYSGCPATQVIAEDIRSALAAHGVQRVRLETQLAPAWTTDWLSDKGRAQLSGYGIAPPAHRVIDASRIMSMSASGEARGLPGNAPKPAGDAAVRSRGAIDAPIACPRCGATRTTRLAGFGSTPCKALYRCDECREPFDYFKPH